MKITATGSDHFQYLLDHQMKNVGDFGNIGRILYKVANKGSIAIIEERLESEIAKQLFSLRYNVKWLTDGPYFSENPTSKNCKLTTLSVLEEDLINHIPFPLFDLKDSGLYKTIHVSHDGNDYFLFAWHHVLMDARGGEVFSKYLLGIEENLTSADLYQKEVVQKSFKEKLLEARDTKDFLMTDKGMEINNLAKKSQIKGSYPLYHIINFSEAETQDIYKKSSTMIRLAKSPFYMSCCAMIAKDIFEKRNQKWKSMWLPVPQDQRLRGSIRPVVGNQVSYLFFRLKKETFTSHKDVAISLHDQMRNQIKNKNPQKYVTMMNFFKRMPIKLYNFLVNGPTKGVIATLFFSDTGNTLNLNDTEAVIDVTHLPPPNLYPGLTIVFSTIKNKLKVSICYNSNLFDTEAEKSAFFQGLKSYLIDSE